MRHMAEMPADRGARRDKRCSYPAGWQLPGLDPLIDAGAGHGDADLAEKIGNGGGTNKEIDGVRGIGREGGLARHEKENEHRKTIVKPLFQNRMGRYKSSAASGPPVIGYGKALTTGKNQALPILLKTSTITENRRLPIFGTTALRVPRQVRWAAASQTNREPAAALILLGTIRPWAARSS